jgi:hypothetical protein
MNASEGPSASDRNFAQIRASKQRISTQMRRFKRHEAQIDGNSLEACRLSAQFGAGPTPE